METGNRGGMRKRNALVFGGVAFVWLILDHFTKVWAETAEVPGTLIADGVPGVFDFTLVHNTGAAWGVLGGSTFALGIFALVFCGFLLVLAHIRADRASAFEMLGYGLVLAGGLGNAIDRFVNGCVVDFICARFIDFPVFNVADIGVTCGFVLIIVFYLHAMRHEGDEAGKDVA